MIMKITREQAEHILTCKYGMKYVKFHYPGYKPVYGRCDRICMGDGVREAGLVIIIMNDQKYTCSPERLKECLTLLNEDNGNLQPGGTDSSKGSPEIH